MRAYTNTLTHAHTYTHIYTETHLHRHRLADRQVHRHTGIHTHDTTATGIDHVSFELSACMGKLFPPVIHVGYT